MQNLIPTDILNRFNEKDPRVFQYVFDVYAPALKRFVEKIVTNTDEAEDIVAVSFYKCWLRKDYFENAQKISAFLFVTARNACLDYLKHVKVIKQHEEKLLQQILATHEPLEEWDWAKLVLITKIYNAIEALPPRCREVFKMAYLYELGNDEIARQTGYSAKTVSTYKSLAIHLLKGIFK